MTTEDPEPASLGALLDGYPPATTFTAGDVRQARPAIARQLIVLDDDPTGTQSVADLPVLTDWSEDDLVWALGTGAPAVYVLTNSRSLAAPDAAARNREVATRALRAAGRLGTEVDFVSRSDSTLRGHFPLEPDILSEVLAQHGITADGVIIVPAFGDAGRITIGSVHYAGSDTEGYLPVGQTQFARDASFAYVASNLRDWVAEKSRGRIAADDVLPLTLDIVRRGPEAIAAPLARVAGGRAVVADIVDESDLHSLALGILAAQQAGQRFIFRVGPPFVRAFIGQDVAEPLDGDTVSRIRTAHAGGSAGYGLVVVGSHVDLTTRQLQVLRNRRAPTEIEIEVTAVLAAERDDHLSRVVKQVIAAPATGTVVLRTSRELVTGRDADLSLDISRKVSDAVVEVVRRVLATRAPRFVLAKGGITSSDVASRALGIRRAMVRGPMLPGIVSLWEPIEGPAQGIPYVVFAGNVGDDASLADVVDTLTGTPTSTANH